MALRFLRGNAQAPKGHAILLARATGNSTHIYCTYCVVPPIPMSLAKYLPPMFAAQLPSEEMKGMPIPPMLEEVKSLQYVEMLAERRGDDLCDLGSVDSQDEGARLQMAAFGSEEYGQLYATYIGDSNNLSAASAQLDEPVAMDDLDADELMLQTMPDRQKLAELGKLIGMARYALEGHDTAQLQESQRRMQRIAGQLAEKYRGPQLVTAAGDPTQRGSRLAELYLSRAYKLLDEEYTDIPDIERAIRELQDS